MHIHRLKAVKSPWLPSDQHHAALRHRSDRLFLLGEEKINRFVLIGAVLQLGNRVNNRGVTRV